MKPKKRRRKNTRQVCLVPVDGKAGTGFGNMKTVDISQGGVGLISNKSINLDEKIAVELELMPGHEPVLMMGQVKWVDRIPESENYRLGLRFTNTLLKGSRSRLTKSFPK